MECPCRRCRRLFRPTTECLNSGSPHWWYCPACQDEQRRSEAQQALRLEPTVAQGRAYPRRRLRREGDPEGVAADHEDLERVLAELGTVVRQRKRTSAR
jgi:hypothetical protein